MKNIVFIPNIDLGNGRNSPYHYSVKSWKHWCDKNSIQLIEWKDPIVDTNYLKVTLQRYWVHDILQHNNIEYDQVLIVDADTIVHPDCPNFFNETDHKFSVVINNGCYEWTTRSIQSWKDAMFSNQNTINTWEYFNGGFQITNKSHIPFYNFVKEFYLSNAEIISDLSKKIKAGTDQTIINFLAKQFKVDIKFLPECYNLQDLFRKNLLHVKGYSWWPDELLFTKAGWVYHFNAIPQNERHTGYWLERTYKELWGFINTEKEYCPISLDYFLNMEVANGGISKQILNLDGKLKTVKDIVEYWKTAPKPDLKPDNWQYYNCMIAGFRKNVANHHEMGWENMTIDYYESLEKMSDQEIQEYLEANPIDFDNGFIKHSYHRAYAMIGRLIRGEKYFPFYMKTERIYKNPTKIDGIHRIKPLTEKIAKLKILDQMGISREEYCLTQSSILAVMGIRNNDDLDIIISTKLRSQNLKFPQGIEVFDKDYDKFRYFGAKGDDDLLENYCITIDGYKFLEPRFYFARKNYNKSQRDVEDWMAIKEFFSKESHKGYPFNFDFYKWGTVFVNKIQFNQLDLSVMTCIRDKYTRVINGVNHGRKTYVDEKNKVYVKIFNPEYCRLKNLEDALESGLYNGLVPALKQLIYDKDKLIGYCCEVGEVIADNDTDFHLIPKEFFDTILRNCKHKSKVYYDLVPSNVIRLQSGQYSLIDLDGVYDIEDLESMKQQNAIYKPENLIELINKI